jgi:hypothetical protein
MMFTYDCPHCGKELEGSFGEEVYCDICDKTYETDYECSVIDDGDSYGAWLTGKEWPGKIAEE